MTTTPTTPTFDLINLPMPFPGTDDDRHANLRTHAFTEYDCEVRCSNCDCRPSGPVAWWPCGEEPPRGWWDRNTQRFVSDVELDEAGS